MKKLYLMVFAAVFAVSASAAPKQSTDAEISKETSRDELRYVGVFPDNVKTIAFISPASYPGSKAHRRGIELVKKAGYKVKVMPNAFKKPEKVQQPKSGSPRYASAPLADRLADFYAAWNDPEVDMIICTRGGTGAQDLIKVIDWNKFKSRNLTLLGYSNVTMLTGAMASIGAGRPVTGPNLSAMVGATDDTLVWLKKMLAREPMPPVKLKPMANRGDAKGPIYAGHLKMLQMVDEGKFRVDTAGKVVFIECVRREAPEVREYLEALQKRGFFDKPAAVVFCYFNRVKDEKAIWKMLGEFAAGLKCPVYRGFPYGHKNRNYALDYTRTAVIKDDTLTFE